MEKIHKNSLGKSLNEVLLKLVLLKNHGFQLRFHRLSTKNNWIISLFLISIALHSLSQPSHRFFCWRKNKHLLSMKTLLLLLNKSPNMRKFCFSVCFLSFFRFFSFSFFGLLRSLQQSSRV